jgi:hypothetical protein
MKTCKKHRLAKYIILIFPLFWFYVTNLNAGTIIVGPGETYTTIEEGIAAASNGDTILVRDGTYSGIIFIDRSLSFRPRTNTKLFLVAAAMEFLH